MLNEEKVALMTKMALYEKNEGKKSMPMSKYYHSDYMSLRLINSAILVTISYFCIIGLAVLVRIHELLDELVNMDLLAVGKGLLIGYFVLILVNLILTYLICNHRFKKYRKGLNAYNGNLKKLYEITKREK